MINIDGKINSAIVFTDTMDSGSIGLVQALCNSTASEGSKIRIMPDVHAGKGCVIGTTMTVTDRISPGLIGVDIGCGVTVTKFKSKRIELQKLDKFIRENIPSGKEIRTISHRYADMIDLSELDCCRYIRKDKAIMSIGTLGGGNHFIEVDKDGNDYYLIVHSGSRNLGYSVASFYNDLAYKNTSNDVPYELSYLTDGNMASYMRDIQIVQNYADINRRAMVTDIVKYMKWDIIDQFSTVHNYIDTNDNECVILRKGAISAKIGERIIIPMNMRDGCLLCTGKGNPEWNMSAPHGAGRLMDRRSVRESFTVSQFKKEMSGIYTTSISKETLDESPMAYKSMDTIVNQIGDTVTVDSIIKPIYNFKAGDE